MSELTIYGIEDSIKTHLAELEKLQAKLEEARKEDPLYQLAREIHSIACSANHTDGCGWHYEFKDGKDDWTRHAHGEYLRRATRLNHVCDEEKMPVHAVLASYKIMRGY